MLSDPANRSIRFLLRPSWSRGLMGAILPCSYRLSFIIRKLWYGCCFLLSQSFVFPKKIVPVVSWSPNEAEIGAVFVF
jgi:hypothetical protein